MTDAPGDAAPPRPERGRVAIVTGAGTGIGKHTVVAL